VKAQPDEMFHQALHFPRRLPIDRKQASQAMPGANKKTFYR